MMFCNKVECDYGGYKMSDKKGRKCLVCGKTHDKNELCQVVEAKMKRYDNFSKKNFLMGNILLECIKRKINIQPILCELVEWNEYIYSNNRIFETIYPMDQLIEYFAVSLNCSSRCFFKEPSKTTEEYSKLISEYASEAMFGRDKATGEIDSIEFYVTIDEYQQLFEIRDTWGLYIYFMFQISKTRLKDGSWLYELSLQLPEPICQKYLVPELKERYPQGRVYSWGSMCETGTNTILLVQEKEGSLKKCFEHILDDDYFWTDSSLITEKTFEDSDFNRWMIRLEKATTDGIMEWNTWGTDTFVGKYECIDILVYIHKGGAYLETNSLYVRNQGGGLGVRFGHDCEENEDISESDQKGNERLDKLAEKIRLNINSRMEKRLDANLVIQQINHTDVMVVTQSMICHNQRHIVTPLRGIVQLLTESGEQESYELYVGYCKVCNKYYVFKSDFERMIRIGKPLCAIYYIEGENKKYMPFQYKSQSVLNAMGYTVDAERDLSVDIRQSILRQALDKELFEVHDILNYLNWLIKTREPQVKYRSAVEKWKEDMKFVESYKEEIREKIKVDSIIVNVKPTSGQFVQK